MSEMIKLFQVPGIQEAQSGHFGILQVVKRLYPYLSQRFQFVATPSEADIIIAHAGAFRLNHAPQQGLIAVCHGLNPTADYPNDGWDAENRAVIDNLVIADEVIVPSAWVGKLLEREMLISPHVLQWGVVPDEWQDGANGGYVLWNKNRASAICTPEWVQALAGRYPQVPFVSTFGQQTDNLRIIGQTMHGDMKAWVKNAGLYLATTKETGDIGSREALAAGVPVLGFAQGALLDFLQHGVNGYLAKPNDVEDLAYGLEYCFRHRATLSHNARLLAQGYTWDAAANQFSEIIETLYAKKQAELTRPLVSVVLPCFNYSAYVASAIQSVLGQEGVNFELIVVDDCSTDNSAEVISQTIAGDSRATLLHNDVNSGVAFTRNNGLDYGRGKYILCLDADDILNKDTLRHLTAHLEANPHTGIAYGGIAFTEPEKSTDWLTAPFNYEGQADGTFNQVPTCCMFRREDALRVGGYRGYMQPAEDADLWTRLLTFTGKKAVKVFEWPAFFYRMHAGSLSQTMRRNPHAERGLPAWAGINRAVAAPPRPGKLANPVRAYDKPLVKVMLDSTAFTDEQCAIPLGLTLDSLAEQTSHLWTLTDAAPLGLRVKAGTWLAATFIEQQLHKGQWPDDNGQVGEIIKMGCGGGCGDVAKREMVSTDDMVLVEWAQNSHDNPIPSPTAQRMADGRVAVYRGNVGSGPFYIFRKDYDSPQNKAHGLWRLVPDVMELSVVPIIPLAPEPPIALVFEEPPNEQVTLEGSKSSWSDKDGNIWLQNYGEEAKIVTLQEYEEQYIGIQPVHVDAPTKAKPKRARKAKNG